MGFVQEYSADRLALLDVVGPCWSIGKLREELGGVSRLAVRQRVDEGALLELPTSDGHFVYPIFQFIRRSGKLEVKPGLLKMFEILKGLDSWHMAVLLNTPATELDATSPVAWEKEGGSMEQLQWLAQIFVSEWN